MTVGRGRALGAPGALAFAGVLATPALAAAQYLGPASAPVESSPESAEAPPLSRRSVKLFDARRSPSYYELDVGPIWLRKVEDPTPEEARANAERGTGELALGTAVKNEATKYLFLTGVQKTLLRVADSKTFSWSVIVQEMGGGLRLGPIEPEARIGLSVLTLDVFHGEWSAQMFSPRVSAGAGFAMGKFRLDIKAHSEYLWRWFGPDYLVHGVTLGLRIEVPRPKSPFPESRP